MVDASVVFSWVYPGQAFAETDQLLMEIEAGPVVVVPSLCFLEVANSLLATRRRKLITATERKATLTRLSNLNFIVDDETGCAAFRKTSELAEKYGLSVYDAAYLEAAIRRKLPLASRGHPLRAAAKRCGVKLRA